MNKKVLWGIIIILLVAVIGFGAYWWGTKKNAMSASQAAQAISDYLNKSQARAVESCSTWGTGGTYQFLDVGGTYSGVWSGGRIVGVCR